METQRNVEPWWKTRNVPWRGVLFQDMILKEDDPEEMRIQKIRKRCRKRMDLPVSGGVLSLVGI